MRSDVHAELIVSIGVRRLDVGRLGVVGGAVVVEHIGRARLGQEPGGLVSVNALGGRRLARCTDVQAVGRRGEGVAKVGAGAGIAGLDVHTLGPGVWAAVEAVDRARGGLGVVGRVAVDAGAATVFEVCADEGRIFGQRDGDPELLVALGVLGLEVRVKDPVGAQPLKGIDRTGGRRGVVRHVAIDGGCEAGLERRADDDGTDRDRVAKDRHAGAKAVAGLGVGALEIALELPPRAELAKDKDRARVGRAVDRRVAADALGAAGLPRRADDQEVLTQRDGGAELVARLGIQRLEIRGLLPRRLETQNGCAKEHERGEGGKGTHTARGERVESDPLQYVGNENTSI